MNNTSKARLINRWIRRRSVTNFSPISSAFSALISTSFYYEIVQWDLIPKNQLHSMKEERERRVKCEFLSFSVSRRRRAEVVNLNLTQYEFSIPPCINPKSKRGKKTQQKNICRSHVSVQSLMSSTFNSSMSSDVCRELKKLYLILLFCRLCCVILKFIFLYSPKLSSNFKVVNLSSKRSLRLLNFYSSLNSRWEVVRGKHTKFMCSYVKGRVALSCFDYKFFTLL